MNMINNSRLWIWLDVSSSCNLSCRDCYTKETHSRAQLSISNYSLLLKKLMETELIIEKLHLNWRGEPLLNRYFTDFLTVRNSIAPNVPIEFHTNGLLLTSAMCKKIVESSSPNDLAYVSIDGGGETLHEENRGKGTWRSTLDGLHRLLDARESNPQKQLKVGIYEISYRRNAIYDVELVTLSRKCDIWTRVSPIDKFGQEKFFNSNKFPQGPCFWAGNAMCITTQGDVHICMLSFNSNGVIGNIFQEEVDAIIERGRLFRARLMHQGRNAVEHCKNCLKAEGDIDD
ncbi:TPA: radical SAM protein [Kluyvera ascorbata]|uniref:Radical SAM protein n=2 Tax=Enterobacterales TaxID=91347 RepID=A0A2T2Y858_9ENTR|nr:hypothetical protein C8256_01650 [Kluyvera genomosp. 2]BBQ83010.1 hypothetical protein WP3W18E02_15390 [Klebsiella sp. WP3-W18-ESBL-02]BBR20044.1 hypothetical protein WP3S18E05_15240 [Klebsiella sp. WP3-S18-ESBL-05]HAT3916562.1 radical SAM protein [Kluyvera ascorbata]HAT3941475.1 radical SAM protein [Kluyvera ascorbata]